MKLEATMRRFNEAADWLAGEAFALKSGQQDCAAEDELRDTARAVWTLVANDGPLHRRSVQRVQARQDDSSALPTACGRAVRSTNCVLQVARPHLALDPRRSNPGALCDGQISTRTVYRRQGPMRPYTAQRWPMVLARDGRPSKDVCLPATDFIGVDFGVVNIATTSDGTTHSGAGVEACRSRYSRRRRSLQQAASAKVKAKVRPQSIRRKLKAISSRESRFRRDVNHCISKSFVSCAKDTARGVAGEDLTYIRERTRFRKPQRARISGWAFFQLRAFLTYKAILAGVDLRMVDPRERRAPALRAGTKRSPTASRKPSSSAADAVMPKPPI
jgi:IS605 OrfB family transposase